MRIAIYTETFYPKIDGVVTRIARTVEQLAALGHEVLLFAPAPGEAEFCGCRVVRIPSVPYPWEPLIRVGLPNPALFAELARFRPDVVHLALPSFIGPWGGVAAKLMGYPVVASYHTNFRMYLIRLGIARFWPAYRRVLAANHSTAALTLVTSQPMIAEAKAVGIKRIRLWPKAVDTEAFHPRNRSEAMRQFLTGGEPDKLLVITAGRLVKEKRIDWLLGPARDIPGIRVAILGEGPEKARLQEIFKDTPTLFPGFLSGSGLTQAFASADAFLFPSDTETLGFVAMESLASGTPVVGARAGGVPTVVEHGKNGLLCDPESQVDFEAKVQQLLRTAELRKRLGAQGRIDMESFSWRAATERLLEFYELAIRATR